MINSLFTIIGLWVVAMIATFVVVCLLAHLLNAKWLSDHDETAIVVSLITFVVFFELFLSTMLVIFKTNPEDYGYTRIETEVTDE